MRSPARAPWLRGAALRGAALLAAALLGAALAAPAAGALPLGSGLATSRTHLLHVRPRVAPGIEASMPRHSAYAAGVALDQQERFDEAAARFRAAEVEFAQARRHDRRPVVEAWRAKARWQSYWSRQLALRRHGYRRWGIASTADLGYAYFMKFLATRAFTGQAPAHLAARARETLEATLRAAPTNAYARVTYATLLHELGEPTRARQEIARVRPEQRRPNDTTLSLRLAAYHAAAGEPDQALAHLERALRRPWARRSLRELLTWSNEFDRLRADPRFQRLLKADLPTPRSTFPRRRIIVP